MPKRKREHFCAARTNADKGRSRLYNAIRKYGEGNFDFCVLETLASYAEALAREIELIAELSPPYNITKGGQGVIGTRITEDGRRRLSEAVKSRPGYWRGKKRPPETIEKFRQAKLANPLRYWLGKKRDAATNAKVSKTKTGVPRGYTPPHALAIFADNMRRAAKNRQKPVVCLTDGKTYESATAADKAYGFSKGGVAGVASGRFKAIYGLEFKYMDRESDQ